MFDEKDVYEDYGDVYDADNDDPNDDDAMMQ